MTILDKIQDMDKVIVKTRVESSSKEAVDERKMFEDLNEVIFRVGVHPEKGETVCVVGNCEELGHWKPHQATELIFEKDDEDGEIWSVVLRITSSSDVEFRFFVCVILEPECDGDQKDLIIRRWETNILPRRLVRKPSGVLAQDNEIATFGKYGGKESVDQGWLTGQTQIQLRLYNNPIHMWKRRFKCIQYRVKITPIDLRYREYQSNIEIEDEEESKEFPIVTKFLPGLQVEVAVLNSIDRHYRTQDQFGMIYNDGDYLVFKAQTFKPDFLAFLVDFYAHTVNATPDHLPQRLCFAYIIPSNLKETLGTRTVPITGMKHDPIGQLTVDYLIIRSLSSYNCDMSVSYARYWKKERALDVGHRGMGNSFKTTKLAALRENTIASLASAASHGADFVEFDVQLSKDLIPVIYHDFTVCFNMIKKGNPGEKELFEIPVKDLTVKHLKQFELRHVSERDEEGREKKVEFLLDHMEDHQPFPTLKEALETIDEQAGFNIEFKYPMLEKTGKYELDHFFEHNMYIDLILQTILEYAGRRQIVLSCFDPDTCSMLRLKQNRHPVLFLTVGETEQYPPYNDMRTLSVPMAIYFAVCEQLLGINVHTEDILKDHSLVEMAKQGGLVIFCWGEDNNDSSTIQLLKKLGVNGVIYDRIHEIKSKEPIFKMEHTAQIALLAEVSQSGVVSPIHT